MAFKNASTETVGRTIDMQNPNSLPSEQEQKNEIERLVAAGEEIVGQIEVEKEAAEKAAPKRKSRVRSLVEKVSKPRVTKPKK